MFVLWMAVPPLQPTQIQAQSIFFSIEEMSHLLVLSLLLALCLAFIPGGGSGDHMGIKLGQPLASYML